MFLGRPLESPPHGGKRLLRRKVCGERVFQLVVPQRCGDFREGPERDSLAVRKATADGCRRVFRELCGELGSEP